MNKIHIVGHGQSLRGAGRADEIDDAPYVCHVNKGRREAEPEDYGHTVDVVCDKLKACPAWRDAPIIEFWGVGHEVLRQHERPGDPYAERREELGRVPLFMPVLALRYWEQAYRRLRNDERAKTYSNGIGAIVCACEKGADEIVLYGFDSVQAGESVSPDVRTERANHDWAAEHLMVPMIAGYYNAEIRYA